MKLCFLSAPYTHKADDAAEVQRVVSERVAIVCEIDAKLMRRGLHTVSPLYKHLLVQHDAQMPSDWDYWKDYSLNLIDRCDALYVVMLDGWEASTGVQAEIKYAREHKVQIVYLNAKGDLVRSEN